MRPWLALLSSLLLAPCAVHAAPPADVVADWMLQDALPNDKAITKERVAAILARMGDSAADLRAQLDEAGLADITPRDVYLKACERRRAARLEPYAAKLARVVFTKHYDLGGSHYAYTEGQSDAQAERHFRPGASLCLLELDGLYGRVTTLLDDPGGVIRDPDVSYDAARILFAWKKDLKKDDYHLYEMTVADRKIRQLTSGLGVADYEGAYLPSGDIVFNSTRCVQIVDCWWTEVSNLYTCGPNGEHLRRLSFDQAHTNFPTVTTDGRVVYTRWDYSDRGQIYPQGLFQMYPDGTGQTELYGNNSWFPTTILHARAIPGTGKYVAVFSGHHTHQNGWLGIINPRMGRQENAGAQLIAPIRETKAVRVDRYGQAGDQWQYPYPLSENAFLVTFKPQKSPRFAIYWMDADGRRELLAADPKISCNQPIPLARRPVPHVRASVVDYRKDKGIVYLQDIYEGPGLAGVPRGAIKRLRVVALEFRAAGIGSNGNRGPAGGAMASTPVSIQGTWDVKRVLGTTPVHDDGSACFLVPARTPVYFQALDANGHAAQTMRSWVTLQPGESVACVGCHENKNSAPPVTRTSAALRGGPRQLTPPECHIQPILDKHCIKCHHLDSPPRYGVPPMTRNRRDLAKAKAATFNPKTIRRLTPAGPQPSSDPQHPTPGTRHPAGIKPAFSLRGKTTYDPRSRRHWSDAYLALANRRVADWINIQSEPTMLPPYKAGAAKSKLIRMLAEGHNGVKLSPAELHRFATWIDLLVPYCSDYTEAMDEKGVPRYQRYLAKRKRLAEQEARNIAEMLSQPAR